MCHFCLRATTIFLIIIFFTTANGAGQKIYDKSGILQKTNISKLHTLRSQYAAKSFQKRRQAEHLAAKFGWKITEFDVYGNFMELQEVSVSGKPKYYITNGYVPFNLGAANITRTSSLWTGGSLGLDLNGEGMTVGEWDDGAVRLTHQEFDANDFQGDSAVTVSNHATHVAGTLVGLGINPAAKGMASEAILAAHDWNSDEAEMAGEAAKGLLISNHSYGWNPLFLSTWEFGYYDSQAEAWDDIQYNAPFYLVVKSAGNDRNGYNTAKGGYDLVNGASASKNTLVVAAVEGLGGYNEPSDVIMSGFSSWGPTDDGRIKPDISAKGVGVFSSYGTGDNDYSILSGTSMAAPNAAGSLVLLQQHYNNLNSVFMKASTLKALIINTAEETGDTPGPDYKFGWGLLNAAKAALLISNENISAMITEETLSDGDSYSVTVTSDGTKPLKASLAWTDPAGSPGPENIVDNPLPMLVNDLDIRIAQDKIIYKPWVLDPAFPSDGASTGDNVVDNVEGITIDFPAAGDYTITVTHKGVLTGASQEFSLVVDGIIAGSPLVCTPTVPAGLASTGITMSSATISWNSVALVDTYEYRFRATGDTTWTTVHSTTNTVELTGLSNGTSYEFQVRSNCTDASSVYSAPYEFTTSSAVTMQPCDIPPQNLSAAATDTTTIITWDAVRDINFYEYIYREPGGGGSWINGTVTTNQVTLTGLKASTGYELRIRSSCANQTSPVGAITWTTSDQADTSCDVPMNIISATITATGATISWDTVKGAVSYNYRYRTDGTTAWTDGDTGSNSVTLSALFSNTTYEYQVQTVCDGGNSAFTGLFIFTTDPAAKNPTSCDAIPTGLTATSTATTADVSWAPVAGVIEYQYRYRPVTGGSWKNGTVTANSVSLTGLSPNTNYAFDMRAFCGSFSPIAKSVFLTLSGPDFGASNVETVNNPLSLRKGIGFYPNPASEWLNIEIPQFKEEAYILIYDGKGKKLVHEIIKTNMATINVSTLKPGMYLLCILTRTESVTRHFVRQ